MALTITSFNKEGIDTLQMLKNRNFGMVVGTIAFDNSYPTGGESAASLAAEAGAQIEQCSTRWRWSGRGWASRACSSALINASIVGSSTAWKAACRPLEWIFSSRRLISV